MKLSIGSRTSERIGLACFASGAIAFVLFIGLLLLGSGCATVRTAWHDLTGTPAAAAEKADRKVETAGKKVDTAKDALVDDAHTKVVLAELLSRYLAEQSKTADALRTTLSGAKADLDTARGALPPGEITELRQIVDQLRSDNAKAQAVAAQAIAALDTSSAQHAEILRAAIAAEAAARAKADAAEARAMDWARERDATARKWDRLWLWIWTAAGAWLAAQILPMVAKMIPAVAPAATALSAIAAPISTYALGRAKALAKDASAALHNVVTTVQDKAPAIAAQVEKIKGEWITEADGTAAAYHETLRAADQI